MTNRTDRQAGGRVGGRAGRRAGCLASRRVNRQAGERKRRPRRNAIRLKINRTTWYHHHIYNKRISFRGKSSDRYSFLELQTQRASYPVRLQIMFQLYF